MKQQSLWLMQPLPEQFAEKMTRLTEQLREQFAESARLEAEIKRNLGGLGYEF
ncbi:hypothetical protein [Thiopseudomonas acetoxidans]|uniref:Uncharacterized protein n=1 Tax=Thiopseudomonas acetoxidans TaxID=3041622 RepID=A0ABT7SLL8_9GAMM|nr:hypothetical protein [Thiopseudomonas sp. CY1220]MDM7857083.1 hypothetical protein [Thiopseudomonas sp. CY1220]